MSQTSSPFSEATVESKTQPKRAHGPDAAGAVRRDRRWRRSSAAIIVALFIACLVTMPEILLIVFLVPGIITMSAAEAAGAAQAYQFVALATAGVIATALLCVPMVGLFAVVVLLSTPRRVCLVVRRFGSTVQNRLLTQVIRQKIGRHYRVITLDDDRFPPIEIPFWERLVLRGSIPLVGITILAVSVAVLALGLMLWSRNSINLNGSGVVGLLLIWSFLMLELPFIIAFGAVSTCMFASILIHRRGIRKAAHLRVENVDGIRAIVNRIHLLRERFMSPAFMAPQATVVRVAHEHWREAVREFMRHADVVLMDLSSPSPSILWELEQARSLSAPYLCISFGEAEPAEQEGTVVLRSLAGRRGSHRMARSLLLHLDSIATSPRQLRPEPVRAFQPQLKRIVLHICVWAILSLVYYAVFFTLL